MIATLRAARRRRLRRSRPAWMELPSPLTQATKALVIAFIVVIMLYPFVYVIAISFATPRAADAQGMFPTSYTLEAYKAILYGNSTIIRALLVSVGVTVTGTFLSVFFTIITAWGLSRTSEVPGSKLALKLVIGAMLFTPGIIPMYLLVQQLGLINSYASLILPGMIGAFNLVVMRNFFMEIPGELIESARIDGAGELRILFRLAVPLSKAVIAVVSLFYAVGYWNNFFSALLYLNDSTKWPIAEVLNQYVIQGSSLSASTTPGMTQPPPQTVQMAVVVLATTPILILYPFAQRHFSKFALTGAIKG